MACAELVVDARCVELVLGGPGQGVAWERAEVVPSIGPLRGLLRV